MMPWDELIRQAPAFGALCFLVVMAGRHIRKITEAYMSAMRAYMVQVRELSSTCHESHREVSETMADRIGEVSKAATAVMERNTNSLNDLRDAQHQTSLLMKEVAILLRTKNGKELRT